MTAPGWMSGPPGKILFATDLSARCDRALDRAAALAAQWQATLVVLHVLEEFETDVPGAAPLPSWRRPPDPASLAWKQLQADVGAVAGKAKVLIEEGKPADVIQRIAEAEGCDLVVIGIARDELLGRFSLGRTVDALLRRVRAPLLVVKDRSRGPYRNIVVATDFSKSSRHALEAAARFFPGQKLTVFHAYDAPMAGIMADSVSYRREYRQVAERDYAAFLDKVDRPAGWQTPDMLIEDGPPTSLLRDYARDKGVELVVLGTHGRSAIAEVFIGSVAKMITDEAPCDALIVREPRSTVER